MDCNSRSNLFGVHGGCRVEKGSMWVIMTEHWLRKSAPGKPRSRGSRCQHAFPISL